MPNYENNNQFGTLFITFDVHFPKEAFTTEQKESKFVSLRLFSTWLGNCLIGNILLLFCLGLKNILKQDDIKAKVYNGLRGF